MTIQKLFVTIYAAMIIMLLILVGFVMFLSNTLTQVYTSQEARYNSYLLADELRQSSDDLTRLARTYAVTGDPKYEEMYWDVLAIRNGEKPRPQNYERLYWDFMASDDQKPRPDGEQIPLSTLMEQLGFTEEEFAKLQEAQNNSDALVWTETIVMNAIKGLYDDGTGNFTVQGEPDLEMASRLMHDQSYHDEKAKIMGPIDDTFRLLDERTQAAVEDNIRTGNILLGAIVALVVTLVALSVASLAIIQRRVTRPIQQAMQTVQQMADTDLVHLANEIGELAQGDLTRSLDITTQPLEVKSNDEIGQMATALNAIIARLQETGQAFGRMTTNLQQLVGQITDNANTLGEASQQLSASSDQAAQATNQIASTIQQVASGTAQQTESVTQANGTVTQLARAIEGVARGAQEQAASVGQSAEITARISAAVQQVAVNAQAGAKGAAETAQTARDGTETIGRTIKGMETIKASTNLVAQKIQEMSQRSEQIGDIVQTIDSIASQTNLLALNAAIEAARAGEHGKGFAVVADEVRKLAESSTKATKEIAGLIKDVQRTITEAVQAMDEGATQVEAGMVQADEAGQALNSILVATEAVNRQVDEIATAAQQMDVSASELVGAMDSVSAVVEENTAATEEMSAGAGEVSLSIENIAAISEENSAASEEMSATVEEVSAQVEEVTASAQSLAGMAQQLQALVTQFKLPDNGKATSTMQTAMPQPAQAWAMPHAPVPVAQEEGNERQHKESLLEYV